ncbi:hypothetical protein ACOSQ3_016627 [Xanthoceras sorbifolium]
MDSIYSLVFIVFSFMYVMVCCYICQAFNPRIGFLTGGGTSIMCSLLFDFKSLPLIKKIIIIIASPDSMCFSFV